MTTDNPLNAEIAENSTFDLVLERIVDVPKEMIWRAWTEPHLLMPWFCPKPWTVAACEIDLRPGGQFSTIMQTPEGQQFPNVGCYLEIIPNQTLTWTNAVLPGFRPSAALSNNSSDDGFIFTVILTLEDVAGGTKYTARCMHADEAGRKAHEAMGFHQGWGMALDQLVAMVKAMTK